MGKLFFLVGGIVGNSAKSTFEVIKAHVAYPARFIGCRVAVVH
jgi:hypothetical protein